MLIDNVKRMVLIKIFVLLGVVRRAQDNFSACALSGSIVKNCKQEIEYTSYTKEKIDPSLD